MMKQKFSLSKVVIILSLLQIPPLLAAQDLKDTVTYNLKQLLKIAGEHNKDLQLVRLELEKSNQQLALKRSEFLPKVDAFADYYWYWNNVPTYIFPENEGNILSGGTSSGNYPVSIGLPNNFFAGISLSQRIFDFSYLSAGKSREVFNAIESGKVKEKKEQIFYDVAVTYYEISQLAAKQDFIDFNINRIDRMIGILQIQLANEMTDSLQVLELELKNAELLLSKKELLSGLQTKTDYLRMLVGLPDSLVIDYGNLDYTNVLEFKPDSNNVESSAQMILINQAQNINELSQKQVQAEYLPTLDFRLNFLWNSQSSDLGFFSDNAYGNNMSTLGLKLNIPIYHGSEKKKKIQELEINKHVLDLQKQKLREGFQLQFSNSLKRLESKTALFIQQQKITTMKKRYFEKADQRFEQGILPLKDLLEAQSGYMEAQMRSAEILYDVKLAELEYFKWSNQLLIRFE
jgi:outer membrane protein TolC